MFQLTVIFILQADRTVTHESFSGPAFLHFEAAEFLNKKKVFFDIWNLNRSQWSFIFLCIFLFSFFFFVVKNFKYVKVSISFN